MTSFDRFVKRSFDVIFSLTGLLIFSPVILISWLIASFETKANGFFFQVRVGRHAKLFKVIKIRTMRASCDHSTVTVLGDSRITVSGKIFRRLKIDELPQLLNVLIGDMSVVGARPDVPGFADRLEGADRAFLSLRPGITGPASIKYRNEELILSRQRCPSFYNDSVIWPDKVSIGLRYIEEWSLWGDICYIFRTFL